MVSIVGRPNRPRYSIKLLLCLPQLKMSQRVVIQIQGLQIGQATSLRWQCLQFIVTKIQEQQIGQMNEQCVGNRVDAERRDNGRVDSRITNFASLLTCDTH